jgi:hypothetical protein
MNFRLEAQKFPVCSVKRWPKGIMVTLSDFHDSSLVLHFNEEMGAAIAKDMLDKLAQPYKENTDGNAD